MKQRFRSGGLAAWSISRPIAVIMLSLSVLVIGLFSLDRLGVDLLPKLIYPEIRVRIIDSGVPARIMEDQITRQLEEQLAITEGVTIIQSDTSEGRSAVSLSFPYDMDIDVALREASTRLDRAKRFLPDTIDPPVIYKRDPSQIPVLEFVVSSTERDPVDLRSWVDYEFSKWFLTVDGVAAAEVGGGLIREIQIIVDQEKLAAAGFEFRDIIEVLQKENLDIASGTLYMPNRELTTRTQGRFKSVDDIARLPLLKEADTRVDEAVTLGDIAQVRDTHEDEKLRIRFNDKPGIKLSIQKQPQANTVAVVDAVQKQLQWFRHQQLLPDDIQVDVVSDQSKYVRQSLNNATLAALSGGLLAMLVVYVFLGDFKRTLIISTAIPLAMMVTLTIMDISGLTLNIMSLGGLALGVGILVDNTIVMLENITRHQQTDHDNEHAATEAAAEVTSAVTASTSTNLAAVLPFLFIGGLTGLMFSELIVTLSASIIASLVVALTLVPALGARTRSSSTQSTPVDRVVQSIRNVYTRWLQMFVRHPLLVFAVALPLLALSSYNLLNGKELFFPELDEGLVRISITGEPGIRLEEMDNAVSQLENYFLQQDAVESVYVLTGGNVFGRSQYERTNRASINVQLKGVNERSLDSKQWVKQAEKEIQKLGLAGFKIRMRVSSGLRGVRTSSGDDDISLRILGQDIDVLTQAGEQVVNKLRDMPGIRNLEHSYEEQIEELVLNIDRQRAADLGISVDVIGESVAIALDGKPVSDYLEGDRQYDIRLRLNKQLTQSIPDIGNVVVAVNEGKIIRLRDVAKLEIQPAPSTIKRDNQRRIVEISASLDGSLGLQAVIQNAFERLEDLNLPEGYSLYDGGSLDAIRESQQVGYTLLALALFLVFVVMAVQYESLQNPMIIMLAVPFTLIGVAIGVQLMLGNQLTMPAKIGLIMLAGIVVNNAIVLVEQIEIQRERGMAIMDAVISAAQLRLRPILMTTLTTVVGMAPLAIGLGEGSEMLQPMATVIVFGLLFGMIVSLFLVPLLYLLTHREKAIG